MGVPNLDTNPMPTFLVGGDPTNTATFGLPLADVGSAQRLVAGTDRSGTAGTTSSTLAAANPTRKGLNIQNISANTLGVNEFGGAAAIGTAGTYTVAAGASLNVRTNRQVNVIASAAGSTYTATEV